MPPKKGKKMALNDFLVDETLGSWADEMDNLPTAPTFKTDEERFASGDRRRDFPPRDRDFGARDSGFPPRQELPLPTAPPFIAFIGNLAFDIYEDAIAEFFAPAVPKEIKVIKDRDEKPKGFGYVEFQSLDDLKDALTRSGGQLASRTVRISVAEAPKERSGGFDDDRFEGPWRRQGPLPPLPGPGPSEARRPNNFGPRDGPSGEAPPPSVADTVSDWRSTRRGPLPPPPERSGAPPPRRPSVPPSDSDHPAHTEQTWAIGSKFKPSEPAVTTPTTERRSLFGGNRPDAAAPSSNPEEVNDWRSGPRRTVSQTGSTRGSPTTSTPPTPQLGGRRKLELLPRGTATPAAESPLSSPRSASATPAKSSPFGAAKPIDVSNREKEVEDRLEQERTARAAAAKEKEASRSSFSRGPPASKSDPSSVGGRGSNPNSPKFVPARALPLSPRVASSPLPSGTPSSPSAAKKEFPTAAAAIRPKFSFAAAAGGVKADNGAEKGSTPTESGAVSPTSAVESSTSNAKGGASAEDPDVNKVTEQVAEVSV